MRAIGRRAFLFTPALALAWNKSLIAPGEFKKRLRGPILSAPTVYTADYAVDHTGMRAMVDRSAKAGVTIFSLTRGNNQYDQLTYEEIKALTRTMAEAAAGRGIFIAATGPWWTGQAVDYARFAESAGADAVQIMPPPDVSDDAYVQHITAIAKAVLIGLVLHGQPSLALLRRLAAVDSLVAIKEEFTTDYTLPIYKELGDRFNIFAGGTNARFLTYRPYGMQAYYSAFATFAPDFAMRFWRAVENNDLVQANEIVMKYDVPFFERWSHPFWRATLEVFGVAGRHQRPPQETFTDRQMNEVKAFYGALGLR